MYTTLSSHFVLALFVSSLSWRFCFGSISLLTKDVNCSSNGTSVLSRIGEPVSIIFCVESDIKIYYYINIRGNRMSDNWYPDNRNKPNMNAQITGNESKTTINITFNHVEKIHINDTFHVTVHESMRTGGRNDKDIVTIRFQLIEKVPENSTQATGSTKATQATQATQATRATPTGGENKQEEDTHYIYIIVPVVLVVVVVAIIIGILIYKCKASSRQTNHRVSDAKIKQVKTEKKTAKTDNSHVKTEKKNTKTDISERCMLSANDHNEDTGHTISEEGLVYVTIASQAGQGKSKTTNVYNDPQEGVEYLTLDFVKSG